MYFLVGSEPPNILGRLIFAVKVFLEHYFISSTCVNLTIYTTLYFLVILYYGRKILEAPPKETKTIGILLIAN